MAGIKFGISPWAYAAGGLAQGAGQGLQTGMEFALQKQQAQRQKQHDAMTLLMQGIKNMPDDPEQGEQYMKFFGSMLEQSTGTKLPDMPWAKAKPWSDKIKTGMEEMKKLDPGMSDTDALRYSMSRYGYTPPKTGKEGTTDMYMNPQTGQWEQAPAGTKLHYPPAMMMPQRFINPVTGETTSVPGGGPVHPWQPSATQVPQTTETETPLSDKEREWYDTKVGELNATTDATKRTQIANQIRRRGGNVKKLTPGEKAQTGETYEIVYPEAKKRTSVRTPGLGGVPTPAQQKPLSQMTVEELKALKQQLQPRPVQGY